MNTTVMNVGIDSEKRKTGRKRKIKAPFSQVRIDCEAKSAARKERNMEIMVIPFSNLHDTITDVRDWAFPKSF